MFLVTRRSDTAGCRERSSSMNAAVTLESLPEESGRNCCLSMLHGCATNLPCLSDITQIRCAFQETFRKLLRASLTSCAPGGAWYRFVVSRGTFYLSYLTRSKHFEGSYEVARGNARNAPSQRDDRTQRQRALDRAGSTLYYERPPKPACVAAQTSLKYSPYSLLHETRVCCVNELKRRNARFRVHVDSHSQERAHSDRFRALPHNSLQSG